MAFRADESERACNEYARNYLIDSRARRQGWSESEIEQANEVFDQILDECGPAVEAYPSWHPLVCNHDDRSPVRGPSEQCGYKGLDHTVYFRNGFVSCPYVSAEQVLESVEALPYHPVAQIKAEVLDVKFYNNNTAPVLVKCEWERSLAPNGMIPLSLAMPLILEKEVPTWRWSQVAETWESMRPYFLGSPHGSRSSLFVDQETGQAIKKIWNAIIYTGMYGNVRV